MSVDYLFEPCVIDIEIGVKIKVSSLSLEFGIKIILVQIILGIINIKTTIEGRAIINICRLKVFGVIVGVGVNELEWIVILSELTRSICSTQSI